MLKRLLWIAIVLLAIVGAAAVAAGLLLMRGGIGSRAEPGRLETRVARSLRAMAIPGDARDLKNPVPPSAEAFEDGLRHFADHCAICHANNGSGETEIGRGLYPKAPDMRQAATQNLTDGELFYIIENGVKLTGMPAWGTGEAEGATESWRLVHFIRRLPQLTEADVERMRQLNPKSPDEWREAEEERRFLEGKDEAPKPAPSHKHKEGGHR
jgi:mono/diheme cytochrome c family protein